MSKTIFCVRHEWYDENGFRLESRCVTHTWHTCYRKAAIEYAKRLEILYANYPERRVERDQVSPGFSVNDGSYELSASRVYAKADERSCIRVALAAVDVL